MKRIDPPAMPADLPDDLATLWQLVRRLAGLMDRQADALCRSEIGVSFGQFLVLSVVDAYPGPLSQQAIADRLGLTKGSVSRQIDAAVTAGLMTVQIAEHTRREHAVALTAAGTALVRRGDRILAGVRSAMVAAVAPDDVTTALCVLRKLLQHLDDRDGPATR